MDATEKLALLILSKSTIDENGLMHFGPLMAYSEPMGMTEEEVDDEFDAALGTLMSDGLVTSIGGSYYMVETLKEYKAMLKMAREEAEQERLDQIHSYDLNVWG